MDRTCRLGLQITLGDPFWILVREAVHQRAAQVGARLISLEMDLVPLAAEERVEILEELLAQDVDALIVSGIDNALAKMILDAGVPLIAATEIALCHPRATSPESLYEVAAIGADYLAKRMNGRGRVLLVGGIPEGFDTGKVRVDACRDVLGRAAAVHLTHIATPWTYAAACDTLRGALSKCAEPFDGIFGISDSLALAGRDVARALGLATGETVVVGINGDPLALAAIIEGTMAATVETPAAELGRQLVDSARQAALGEPLLPHFSYKPRLVTRENVAEVAAEKLVTIATVPSRLVGFSRAQEAQRIKQLETSLAISQRMGSILDRQQLSRDIAEIIRANFNYDRVLVYFWSESARTLALDGPGAPLRLGLDESGLLGETLQRNQPTFIPDMRRSQRYAPDPRLPACRSRVILPIRFGRQVLGLLDLQSEHSTQHSYIDLVGLQALGDQLGIALRNADLYGEAITAQAEAAQASQLKNRLLANVSHELRAPLNIIQGYSQAALATPNPYDTALPPALLRDLGLLYRSSEHLGRIINDLLDLSRAEINALDVFPEPVAPTALLTNVFQAITGSQPARAGVAWRLELPEALPEVRADPARLRQIIDNLLSNSRKFTERGHITLGALTTGAHLHIWVEDTGEGIPLQQQQFVFRAFITAERPRRPVEGLGLGLRITHELVRLHNGTITFTSVPGAGTTFHLYLPLPAPESDAGSLDETPLSTLPGEANLPARVHPLTRQTVAYLRQNYEADSLSRSQIAAHAAVSESYLTRLFRRDVGIAPWEYLTRYRIARAKELLRVTRHTVTEIANRVGYNDGAYFSRVFHQETGRSPLAFRRHAR